ncbi:Glycosyltransferase involved in cell wall bisynthesis [Flexibacter flexilis DSM 6793]|uniref:Glycosyltransferase involved in cell wall bisynthesis n=1 Tax=Flexibacter flexilis DSM 6793 TaxID=927664 RepID=A0A1I1FQ65_9BACT|nr:glycosyltransferase [Flexibacter flexilis]SFC01484.1 Glycosyltransferase involved in cell wall bisynthesis [Flexibacter flexilis DSM 6793]
MKKIILTVTTDISYDQRMQRICATLHAAGYEVWLVGRLKKTSSPLPDFPYHTRRLKCFWEKGKFFYIEYNIRLFFWLLGQKFEAVCGIDLDTIAPAVLVGKLKGKKTLFDAHEYFTQVPELIGRPRTQRLWEWIEKRFVPRVDAAYTVSESLAKIFENQLHIPFGLVRNIGTPLAVEPAPTPDKSYLIYIGAVNAGRGLEQLIEAMQQIDYELYVCGDGDILEALKAQAVAQGVAHKVKFWGYVKPQDLHQLTTKARIGYLLLDNKSQSYYYSLANKFFDYIHAGIPQITSNFPEYQLINQRYKVAELVELRVTDIVASTQKLLQDENYYQKMAENARLAQKELCWENEQKTLLGIWEKVLGKS